MQKLSSLQIFLIYLFIFIWRIIALHYVGFCHISTQISHRYTYVPSLLNLSPTSHPLPYLQIIIEQQILAPGVIQWEQTVNFHLPSNFTRKGNGTPLQYSCLAYPKDGGAWWAAVHGVAKSRTRLSDFPFTFHFHALEKEMATHSSVLAWRIPGTGEPGGLQSMGSHRVGHD